MWRACWCQGSFQGVDQGTVHLMVGSPTGVEVVVEKVHRKKYFDNGKVIHMTMEGFEAFNGEGGVARKGLSH